MKHCQKLLSLVLMIGIVGCSVLPDITGEPLERKLRHGQTRVNIMDCIGTPDAYLQEGEKEVWMYGLQEQNKADYRDGHSRYNLEFRKSKCRMDVVFGKVFAETYRIHSKDRGIFGDYSCYAVLNECAPR